MNKNMKWLAGGLVAGLLVIAIAVPVMAAGPNGVRANNASTTWQAGFGVCQGLGSGPDESVATLLGLTQEQIREKRQAGESLVQIAVAQNVTQGALISAIMAKNQETIRNMVTAGTLTQEQADLRLAQMQERVQLAVNRTTVGSPDWAGANSNGQRGTGKMGQGGQKGNQLNCDGTAQMRRFGRNGK